MKTAWECGSLTLGFDQTGIKNVLAEDIALEKALG